VERDLINNWINEKGISDLKIIDQLYEFSILLYNENKKFNLTGCSSLAEIIEKLIIQSLDPLIGINVPRGTSFIDMGSGAGIPGIPLAILFKELHGICLEANAKKVSFIENSIEKLGIDNLKPVCARAEDAGRETVFREKFSWIFTRAMADIFISLELGACFLKKGGLMYIYSNEKINGADDGIIRHAGNLGLELNPPEKITEYNIVSGLLFKKIGQTDNIYPRRFSVLKRMSRKIKKN